jgi:hypothetical protein
LQFVLQLIGIIGQRIEIAVFQNHRASILLRVDAHTLILVIDGDLLLLHFDREREF